MAMVIPKDATVPNVSMQAPNPELSVTPKAEPVPTLKQLHMKARQEGAFIHDDTVVAKPLSIPGQNIKLKNPNVRLRWVNFKAGGGLQFQRMQLSGFTVAKETDAEIGDISFTDGAFKNGDLILMKISREQYDAALKYNAELGMRRVGRENILQQGRQNISEALKGVGATPELKRKISAFVPSDKDMEHTPLAD